MAWKINIPSTGCALQIDMQGRPPFTPQEEVDAIALYPDVKRIHRPSQDDIATMKERGMSDEQIKLASKSNKYKVTGYTAACELWEAYRAIGVNLRKPLHPVPVADDKQAQPDKPKESKRARKERLQREAHEQRQTAENRLASVLAADEQAIASPETAKELAQV